MKGPTHGRQEHSVGIGDIPAQTGISRHETDEGRPSGEGLINYPGRCWHLKWANTNIGFETSCTKGIFPSMRIRRSVGPRKN